MVLAWYALRASVGSRPAIIESDGLMQTGWPTAGEACCKMPVSGFPAGMTLLGVPSETNTAWFHYSLALRSDAAGEVHLLRGIQGRQAEEGNK
jgi:hypothetical protein